MFYRERRSWTPQEDQLLRDAVAKEDPGTSSPSKWHAIAKHVPNRTNKDCRKRWFAKLSTSDVVKGNWAPDEDDRLVKAIEKYGTRWTLIAAAVHTRNSDQCAKRWKDTLDPTIDRTSWTSEEDVMLLEAVEKHGKFWSKIVKTYFPGRTGLSAKNRYNSITRGGHFPNGFPPVRRQSPCESDASSSSASTSSASVSPVTPAAVIPELSAPSFTQPSCFDLNDPFTWSPAQFSDIDDSALDSLTLDGLFTLPPIKYPYGQSIDPNSTSGSGPKNSHVVLSAFSPFDTSATSPCPTPSGSKVLKLYGSTFCASTARVQIVLHEKQVPYEFINLDMSENELRYKQPFGQIPYIDDDGFIVCESRAICRYIATKYAGQGTKLIPDAYNIKAGALFEQAVFSEVFNFDPYASKAGYERVIKRWKGLAPDEAVFEASVAGLSSKLEGYEMILSQQKYLAGDELTLADLYHLPCGAMLTEAGSDILTRKGPNVSRWWNDISSRESWQAVKNGHPVKA